MVDMFRNTPRHASRRRKKTQEGSSLKFFLLSKNPMKIVKKKNPFQIMNHPCGEELNIPPYSKADLI